MSERMQPDEFEAALANRKAARKMALDQAVSGDDICGALFALESLAEPFYLGLDYDDSLPDNEDVRPF